MRLIALIVLMVPGFSQADEGWWVVNEGEPLHWNWLHEIEAMGDRQFQSTISIRDSSGRERALLKAPSRADILNAYAKAKKEGQKTPGDALDELNGQRAARGLRPYIRDAGLSKAALDAATYRAGKRISGHCNDFSFLPPGSFSPQAGVARWPQGMGFGACGCYENWTHAGAAYAIGSDGFRYMHLFVR